MKGTQWVILFSSKEVSPRYLPHFLWKPQERVGMCLLGQAGKANETSFLGLGPEVRSIHQVAASSAYIYFVSLCFVLGMGRVCKTLCVCVCVCEGQRSILGVSPFEILTLLLLFCYCCHLGPGVHHVGKASQSL